MEQKFKLNDKKIIIYATGPIAKILIEQIPELDVEFFIDLRGDEIDTFLNLPVYSMQQLSKLCINKEEHAIIISMRNVFEHDIVAKELFNLGFHHLIFKPLCVLEGCETSKNIQINAAYEDLITYKRMPQNEIPVIAHQDFIAAKRWDIISEADGFVTCYVRPELLFTNYLDNKWSVTSFVSTFILVDLYKAFEGREEINYQSIVQEYINDFVLPEVKKIGIDTGYKWENVTIGTRLNVYQEMNSKMAKDYSFFVKNCPTVKYLSNGKFTLISSGKNRVSFLISKYIKYIPVKVSKEDYSRYLNSKEAEKLQYMLSQANIYKLPVPISHPYFYNYRAEAEDYFEKWVSKVGHIISRFICQKYKAYYFDQVTVCDMLDDWGTVGRHLQMLGCKVERTEEVHNVWSEQIDKLFYIESFKEINTLEHYTAIIISATENESKIKAYLKKAQVFCFVLCINNNYEIFETLVSEQFIHHKKIFISIWGNNVVEGFVFAKESLEAIY